MVLYLLKEFFIYFICLYFFHSYIIFIRRKLNATCIVDQVNCIIFT